MKRKGVLLVLAAALCLTLPLAAYDFGGTIDNSTAVGYAGGTTLLQEDKLALWFSTGIGKSLELTAQGSFTFTYEKPSIFEYLLDVDLFHLSGSFLPGSGGASQLTFRAGRFAVADLSQLVLNDRIDGLQIGFNTHTLNTLLAVGYSGLQFDPASTINITRADDSDGDRLAPPRLIGSLQALFPELFGRQDLLVSLLMQQDLRTEGATFDIDGTGGRLSSQYFGLGMAGPLAASLYYQAFAYLGTGSTPSDVGGSPGYATILSLFSGLSLRYFFPGALSSKAELRLLLASGDEDFSDQFDLVLEGNTLDLATAFVPISRQQLAVAFSPRLVNLVLIEAGYSLKPLETLQAQLKVIVFLRPTGGPISDSRLDPASDSRYLGSELDAVLNYRPFSDLGAALSLGLFLPMGGAFADSSQEAEFRGRLEISLSF